AIADIAVLKIEKGSYGFVDSFGARMDGTLRLVNEMTISSGHVAFDLNGRARERWDKLGKYQAQGEPWWDWSRGGGKPMPLSQ
ncbi:MAG: amidohydrolase/deacetylase family metallohydrolase, partial [Bryobacterales bacterium]|nr:amidohydrolase/deacetylase family metallohydrolase [Bryobacterales bacterium]